MSDCRQDARQEHQDALDHLRNRALDFVRRLKRVTEALPQGNPEDSNLILQCPQVADLADVHSQICATKLRLQQIEEQS